MPRPPRRLRVTVDPRNNLITKVARPIIRWNCTGRFSRETPDFPWTRVSVPCPFPSSSFFFFLTAFIGPRGPREFWRAKEVVTVEPFFSARSLFPSTGGHKEPGHASLTSMPFLAARWISRSSSDTIFRNLQFTCASV